MTVHKRPKCVRYRASHTHGKGSKKKRRGSGNRGGKGYSSTGKRSDARLPSIWKNPDYLGRIGFHNPRPNLKEDCVISLSVLEDKLSSLTSKKIAEEKSGIIHVDLNKMGIHKLVSQGRVTKKWQITVDSASKVAIKKVEQSGGKVVLAK